MISEETSRKIRDYIEYLLDGSTAEKPLWNQEQIRGGAPFRWNYADGVMISALLSLYGQTREKRYLEFADRFVSAFVQEDGSVRTYCAGEKNLDNLCAARNLFPLYDLTGKEKYRKAMDTFRAQIDIQPRTREGNFWHKQIYPWQVWLDGLYMAQPFYMAYETRYRKMEGCRDIIRQFANVRRLMRDPATGLYYHGYDESRQMYWADPETGCSPNFWLRSIGWFMAALAETAENMSETLYNEYRYLQRLLCELTDAMLPWQGDDGMFFQLVNLPGDPGNYPETSGTALFAYAVLKAVRLDYLPDRYAAYAEKAFDGIVSRYLTRGTGSGGEPPLSLGGICLVAGLGGKQHRDGSRAYYYGEPVVKNDAKGTGPFVLAYTELLRRHPELA